MKAQVFVNRAMTIMMPALMLVMNCIAILIVWVGGHNVNDICVFIYLIYGIKTWNTYISH